MPPIISIVGNSKSGKTTLIEKLIGELKSRGYRVATIKHVHHDLTLDQPDKDSWRHLQAGSEATAIGSPTGMILIKPVTPRTTLDMITPLFAEDYDIILVEGFKQENTPKIEVHRREAGPLLSNLKRLIAIVTDEPLATQARQFSLDDIKGLADLLEKGFLIPQQEGISLYINNMPVVLSAFPKEFIAKVLLAMVSSLKGITEVKNVKLFLRKGKRE